MKFKKIAAMALSLAMIGSLAACGGAGGDTSGGTNNAGEQITMPNGDVLDNVQSFVGYIQAEPATLDSSKASDQYSNVVFINVMEPLTRIENKDGQDVVTPASAESWSSNEDGTVWTFTLRDNKWSDGQPVKAQDFEYGIKRVMDPETGSPNSFFLTSIKNAVDVNSGALPIDELGVKALDDKTLEITLEAPTPYFLSLTYTRAMYPMRQDIVEQHGDTYGAEMDTLVYNGPFVMTGWTHNNQITLGKNDQYWDKDNVYLTDVTYNIVSDANAIYNSFDNGTFDSVSVTEKEWMDRFSAKEGVLPITYINPQISFGFYNLEDPIFKNENMRMAFTAALDREEMVDIIYQGTMAPAYSWVPEDISAGELGSFRTQVGAEPLKKLLDENTDAKALLLKGMEELGLGSDPSTLDLTFSFGVTSQWMRNFGEYIQQVFKTKLGVEVKLDYNEWAIFQSNVNSGNYQMGYMAWTIDYNDPMSMLSIMLSGTNNVPTGWVNEDFDSIIHLAEVEMDEQKRVELYKRAEEILIYDDAVINPFTLTVINRFVHDYVKNMPDTFFVDYVAGLKGVYISGK